MERNLCFAFVHQLGLVKQRRARHEYKLNCASRNEQYELLPEIRLHDFIHRLQLAPLSSRIHVFSAAYIKRIAANPKEFNVISTEYLHRLVIETKDSIPRYRLSSQRDFLIIIEAILELWGILM
jgi:hypothetical protein